MANRPIIRSASRDPGLGACAGLVAARVPFGAVRRHRFDGVTALARSRVDGCQGRNRFEFAALKRLAPGRQALGRVSSRFHFSGF